MVGAEWLRAREKACGVAAHSAGSASRSRCVGESTTPPTRLLAGWPIPRAGAGIDPSPSTDRRHQGRKRAPPSSSGVGGMGRFVGLYLLSLEIGVPPLGAMTLDRAVVEGDGMRIQDGARVEP